MDAQRELISLLKGINNGTTPNEIERTLILMRYIDIRHDEWINTSTTYKWFLGWIDIASGGDDLLHDVMSTTIASFFMVYCEKYKGESIGVMDYYLNDFKGRIKLLIQHGVNSTTIAPNDEISLIRHIYELIQDDCKIYYLTIDNHKIKLHESI